MKFFAQITQALRNLKPLPPEASTPALGLTIETQKALLHAGPAYTKEVIKEKLLDSFYRGIQPYRGEDFNTVWHEPPTHRAGSPADAWHLLHVPSYARGRFEEFFDRKFDASFDLAQKNIEVKPQEMAQNSQEKLDAIKSLVLGSEPDSSGARVFSNVHQRADANSTQKELTILSCSILRQSMMNWSVREPIASSPLPKLFNPSDFRQSMFELGLSSIRPGEDEKLCEVMLNNPHFGNELQAFVQEQVATVQGRKPRRPTPSTLSV